MRRTSNRTTIQGREIMDRVEDELVRHAIGLRRYDEHVLRRMIRHLEKVQADVERQIVASLPGITLGPDLYSKSARERLYRLRQVIKDVLGEAHNALRADLADDMHALAQYEAQYSAELFGKTAFLGVNVDYPSRAMLRSIVTSRPFQGATLTEWAKKMERAQVDRIWQHVQIGLTEKESTDQIVKRLRGTGALQYRDGQFAKDQRSAEALVRTATNHVHNQAHAAVGEANSAATPRYRWSSILDARTTPICRSRAGQIFKTGEGPLPPAHWNCRSKVVYLRAGSNAVDEPRFDQWLDQQDTATQVEVLGRSRQKLWREGKMSVREFVDRKGKPLRLDQLRERDHAAWERAGLK